jgi:hypothetical protein
VLHRENPAADTSAAPTPARDAAGNARSRSWLVWARVELFDERPAKVMIRYFDADGYHAALSEVAALDREERRLRARLRDLAPEDDSRGGLLARLREIPRERAAAARRMVPAGEVAVAVTGDGDSGFAPGRCACRLARAGRPCRHPELARLAVDAWLGRGQRRAEAAVLTSETPSSTGEADEGADAGLPPYVDPAVCADDLQPVRHVLPRWCYTSEGVRRPLLEALGILEDLILPLERELARRGVSLPGAPCSVDSLRRAYAASWEPVGWRAAPSEEASLAEESHPASAPRLAALDRQVLRTLSVAPQSYRDLVASLETTEGGIARALGRLQMLSLVEVRDGRYRVSGAAEVSG